MTQPPNNKCSAKSGRPGISLPVLGGGAPADGPIARSRAAPIRAIVLAAVQLLILLHIVLWLLSREFGWFGGITLTPIEPSESMDFAKYGAINAGLIFFVLAMLSTLLFGRWFCGWGCHLVLLQDLCTWLLKRMGIRPRPFRSRLLLYVPLVLALYMFVWPAVYRWGIYPIGVKQGWWAANLVPWQVKSEMVTTEFWKTFAGVAMIIPFLGVCGFATVYFLGNKGFCTYGCPYGGFFAPIDRYAPARIRVTDACEGCGHCTAVCSSNVRVHEEVRDFGMVVDPGCMKCLDCVSVCPNDALYWGFGKPAAFADPRKDPPPRRYDVTWTEEIVLAVIFFVSFMSFRSVYGLIPMLMAVGIAGCVTWICWKSWHVIADTNASLHRARLKHQGRVTRRGGIFLAATAFIIILTVHCGAQRSFFALARHYASKVPYERDRIFAANPPPLGADAVGHAERALSFYGLASSWTIGGIAIPGPWQGQVDMEMAQLHSSLLDFSSAETLMRGSIERNGASDRFCSSVAWMLRVQGSEEDADAYYQRILTDHASFTGVFNDYVVFARDTGRLEAGLLACENRIAELGVDEIGARWKSSFLRWLQRNDDAIAFYETTLMEQEDFHDLLTDYMSWLPNLGRAEDGMRLCEARLERFGDEPATLRWKGLLMMDRGKRTAGIDVIKLAIELDPEFIQAYRTIVDALWRMGRPDEALEYARLGVEVHPRNSSMHLLLAEVLGMLGHTEEEQQHRQRADELRRQHQ